MITPDPKYVASLRDLLALDERLTFDGSPCWIWRGAITEGVRMTASNPCPCCASNKPLAVAFSPCVVCSSFVCSTCRGDGTPPPHGEGHAAFVCRACTRVAERDRVSISITWDARGRPRLT